MVELNIFWTQTAVNQRKYIFEYWNNRNISTSYAKKLNASIKERTKLLKTNPDLEKKSELFKQEFYHWVIIVFYIEKLIIELSLLVFGITGEIQKSY